VDPVIFSIKEPVKVAVIVLVIVLFGFIGLLKMPYQLSPDLTVPLITIRTTWDGATPYEVEREIIEEQEKVFKGIPNLEEMESQSSNNRGSVTLKFKIGTDINEALLRVSNKLNEVRSYPANVERPVISATGESTSPVIWMALMAEKENDRSIYEYRTFFENEIRQYLERVDGVADLFVGGGTEEEMHVTVDPQKLASYKLTIGDVAGLLSRENVNISAGNLFIGRRDFRIRTVSEFQSAEELEKLVIMSTGQKRIFLSDIAEVTPGFEKRSWSYLQNDQESIGIGIRPQSGVNILELTDRMERAVEWLNTNKLKSQKIRLHWSYDQRPYIKSAIGLVQSNILIGGILAVFVLLLFLRSFMSTLVVATALPISVIGSFFFLNAFGRTLNVVSLAGISFAIGMLLDSAIVVLENIDRHRKMGKSAFNATYEGTKEVWGAILASSLTTVAVFLPVVFIEEEAGQLFRDIAIAVTCAIVLSLFVSISVIPSYANMLFSLRKEHNHKKSRISRTGTSISNGIMKLVSCSLKNRATRLSTIAVLAIFSILTAYLLAPKMEYLPQGNRNYIYNLLVPPPGLSYEERRDIGKTIFKEIKPYMNKESYNGLPGIKNAFYTGADRFMFCGAISTNDERAGDLVPLFSRIINSIPGVFGVSSQGGIFQSRLGGGRTIDCDISGSDMEGIVKAAEALFDIIKEKIPDCQIRPKPSIEILYPEVNIIPDRDRLRASGMNAGDLGISLDVLLDGRKISEFKKEGQKKIDLVLRASEKRFETPEQLYDALISTPQGKIVPVYQLADIEKTTGVTEIRHLERQRTITLQVTPPKTTSLEEAMDRINKAAVPQARSEGLLDGIDVTMSGEADKLTQTRRALQWDFLLAAAIIYLLMAGLFSNFLYPLIILFTLPLAAAGGLIGLRLVNLLILPQPLDILTMLGFVILIGVVVNNAILIVYQSLNNVRTGNMDYRDAILEATRTRLRPIYMSTFTSIFGMLPLVVLPGAGSEIYRGLGSVILGGLAISSIFVIFIIPSLLMFLIKKERFKENKSA